MGYELVKKKNNKHVILDFDDWNYYDRSCLAVDISLKEHDVRRFILENIEIKISKNGPHSRIHMKGNYIQGFSDGLDGTNFHYYKALEYHRLTQAQEFIIKWFEDFDNNLFDGWEDLTTEKNNG